MFIEIIVNKNNSSQMTIFGRPFIQELTSSWDGRPWLQ